MITVQSAIEIILDQIKPLDTERVDILSSLNRVLGETIHSVRPNPPWDNSAMDGYALKTDDIREASPENPVELKVVYDLPAGQAPKRGIVRGEAVRIMTGAPIPDGCDAVVMVEQTEKRSDGSVLIRTHASIGENIRLSGEDFEAGEAVLDEGTLIRPAEIGMLAALGVSNFLAYRRPKVALISTGDELVDINEIPGKGKIFNSNGYALSALVSECGAQPIHLGIARDTKESLREKLVATEGADCIITSGGVSVGDYDFVKDVLQEMGSEMVFWKVAIKPGKPLAFGMIGGKPAFGLPGNPVSSIVVFEQFVRPTLFRMAGRQNIFRKTLTACLTKDVKIIPDRMNLIRGELRMERNDFLVTPLEGQGSNLISSMVGANSFVIVPKGSMGFKKGSMVKVQPFDLSMFLGETYDY